MIKTRSALVALCTILVIGCNNKDEEFQKQLAQAKDERVSSQQSIAERNAFFEEVMREVNEVYTDLENARSKEAQLLQRTGDVEGPPQFTNAEVRKNLLQNISDIGSALKENRLKIADLQTRVKSSRGQIASLNTLISNLKTSLEEREVAIAQLESRVQGLEATVAEKTKVIDEQQKKMQTAFFVIGTRDELRKKGIITDEGGFLWGLLGSTTVMSSGADLSAFAPIDKTKEHTIVIPGKLDELVPRRNPDFFATAQEDGGTSELTIVSPEKFWQDNYLIIVVD